MDLDEPLRAKALRLKDYDTRLDSDDVIVRQQAEIEALRTALVASNSESNGECDRLRFLLDAMTVSYEGQRRNTLAFKAERDVLLEAATEALKWMEPDVYSPNCRKARDQVKDAILKATTSSEAKLSGSPLTP